jgi:TolB-like protein
LSVVREHFTHWLVGGLILMATGFTPEDWLVHLLHSLHLPAGLAHAGSAGVDVRVLVMILGVAVIVLDVLWRQRALAAGTAAIAPAANPPTAAAPQYPVQEAADRLSIAVLPFTNMSGDPGQEFFADGMTEEITAVLTKIPDLRVVGRTSAFQFKGRSEDLRQVGRTLQAAYLIEGSVRKAGERLRITAQLIQTETGTHLWAETYERDFTDIFAVQEEIARSVATWLRVPLGLSPALPLVANRTNDLRVYEQYLRALTMVRARRDLDQAVTLLEQAVDGNVPYAPAWALLGYARSLQPYYSPIVRAAIQSRPVLEVGQLLQSIREQADLAARRAIELDPRLALGHATRATVQFWRGQWTAAAALYRHALEIDPDDPDTAIEQAIMLASLGFPEQSVAIAQRVRLLEPLAPTFGVFTAFFLQLAGQNAASLTLLEAMPQERSLDYRRCYLTAKAYAVASRIADAVEVLSKMEPNGPIDRESVATAVAILRTAREQGEPTESLPRLNNELNFVYGIVGAPERMLEFYEHLQQSGLVAGAAGIWDPLLVPVRNSARFKAYLSNAGLVASWRESGWPTACRPGAAGDFECS